MTFQVTRRKRIDLGELSQLNNMVVRVGVLAGTGLHKSWGKRRARLSVAEIAWINEFGSRDGRVPSRPFLRSTMHEQRAFLTKALIAGFKKALRSKDKKAHGRKVLDYIGLKMQIAIKMKIDRWKSLGTKNLSNSEFTQMRKGNKSYLPGTRANGEELSSMVDQPLVDTGEMKNSIQWLVGRD